MPWVPLDIHYLDDHDIEAAAEMSREALLVFPAVLAMAKAQSSGGEAEFTYRGLSHKLFSTPAQVTDGIRALVSAGVLSCPQESERGATVAFDPDSWRRWNDMQRKAASRGVGTA